MFAALAVYQCGVLGDGVPRSWSFDRDRSRSVRDAFTKTFNNRDTKLNFSAKKLSTWRRIRAGELAAVITSAGKEH